MVDRVQTITYLRGHSKILFLSLLIACNSIPAYALTYVPGIDGPLPWVYNYFADGHYDKCVSLLFPHGPLAFLLYPLMVGNNALVTVLITFVSSFLLSVNLFMLVKSPQERVISALGILFLQTFLNIQLILIALTLTYVLLFRRSRDIRFYLPAVLFAVLNLYIKSYGGVICLLILFSDWVLNLVRKEFKPLWAVPLAGVLVYYFFRLSLFRTFDHSIDFLRGQIELSGGNSSSVSFFQSNDWMFIGAFIFFFFLFPFVVRNKESRYLWFIMLLPCFAAWKHGMSRGDNLHVQGFVDFLLLFYLVMWIFSPVEKTRIALLGALACGAFIINMGNYATYNDFEEEKRVAAIKPFNLYKMLFRSDSLARFRKQTNDYENRNMKLPDALLKIVGKQPVDIWPWNYSLIAVNNLNWQPRPTLHTYAMYSEWLDEQNADHFASDRAPQYIIWDIKELGGGYRSADSRYLLNDGPLVTERMISGYKLKYKDEQYFLYEKKAVEPITKIAVGKESFYTFSDWIEIPRVDSLDVLRAKISLRNNVTGTLKSFLYKGEGFHIVFELHNGETRGYKIVPGNSEQGMWVYPLIFEPGAPTIESQARRMKIFSTDTSMIRNELGVAFERIMFKNNYDLLSNFFGKR